MGLSFKNITTNSFHLNFPFQSSSSNKYTTNILMNKSILPQLNCQDYFLVEHKTMVYLRINGRGKDCATFFEERCQQQTTAKRQASHTTPASFKLPQTLTGSCRPGQQGTVTFQGPLPEPALQKAISLSPFSTLLARNRAGKPQQRQHDSSTPTDPNTAGVLNLDLPTLTVPF